MAQGGRPVKKALRLVTPQGTTDGNMVVTTATTCPNNCLQQDQEKVCSKAFQDFFFFSRFPLPKNKVSIPNKAS